jgi:hypothetical protein
VRRWKYRKVGTTTLRAYLAVLSASGLRRLFAEQIADIEMELLARALPSIAEETGGYLVPWILGEQ